MKKIFKEESGAALAMTLIVMLVLTIFGSVFLNLSLAENKFAIRNEDKLQAYYIARSSAQAVAEYLVKGEDASKVINKVSDSNSTHFDGGEFQVAVEYPNPLNTKIIDVTSTAKYNGITQLSKIRVEEMNVGQGMFEYPFFSFNETGMSSGNSVNGVTIIGGRIGSNGSIEVNGSSGGYVVPGEDPYQNFPLIPIDDVTYDVRLPITSERTFVAVTDDNLGIPYIDTTNNEDIIVNGTGVVNMYITGDVNSSVKGDITIDPNAQLHIYVLNSKVLDISTNVNITGKFFIYAPYATVKFGSSTGSDINGIIIANNIYFHNHMTFTYDETIISQVTGINMENIGVTHRGYTWLQ